MQYKEVVKGRFLSRPNRFIAKVEVDGKEETVHVKNTGRCKELLTPHCTVYLSVSDNPNRKTRYDLIAALKERDSLPALLINLDSQSPNEAVNQWLPKSGLFEEDAVIKREATYKNSRFDFMITERDRTSYLEVKGVTQERDGVMLFPDAPTERGVRHIRELMDAKEADCGAYILFVVQTKGVSHLIPNDETHIEFGKALRDAEKAGVKIIAVDTDVTPDSMVIRDFLPVKL